MGNKRFGHRKPETPQKAYERRMTALPPMPEDEREALLLQICREVGLDPESRRSYAGY